mmetsp:Transcript_15862/g.25632  ORF Transcript_15862/g.25632 Transcript_15862/m.25632 type:complete len:82 (+) Transcript_15862:1750-1995(+)
MSVQHRYNNLKFMCDAYIYKPMKPINTDVTIVKIPPYRCSILKFVREVSIDKPMKSIITDVTIVKNPLREGCYLVQLQSKN